MSRPTPSIDEVFFAAMERESPEARAAYLDEVCAEDPDLRLRVERLLDAQPKVGSFLDAPAAGSTLTLPPPQAMEGPGTVIGPYKLLEQIGEGGMGVVYMAEQTQPVRRKVALKIIKPGMDTRQVIARFEAERQALAMMDHPNIAKVLDAGATESGRPYFVMELVRGIPITEYCDQHCLPIPERLDLFMQVCQAVQHAHQKGIIHRDIKPTNVLVASLDGVPLPRVIDFGIVKATGQSLTDKTLFTGFAQLIGTPLYMSPEQAELSAVDVDTRSDIYSLGVLLYELLTGTTPFDQETFRTAALDEVRRIIREQEPSRPSTRLSESKDTLPSISARRHTEPARLTKLLRGELDWIVMKALEKDRRRRYETANGLARDVERYLAGDAVEAGPPSGWYRLRKFARRNRLVLTTTVLVALALIAGTTVSVWQALLARRARADAIAQRDRAKNAESDALAQRDRARKAVDEMYTEVAQKWLSQQPQLELLQREFLLKALAFYQEFARERGSDPEARRGAARAEKNAGDILGKLGEHSRAESTYRRAVEIQEALMTAFPKVPEYRMDLANSYSALGKLLRDTGQLSEAERTHSRSLELWEALVAEFPKVSDYRRNLARSYNLLGFGLRERSRFGEAEQSVRRAIELQEALVTEFPKDSGYRNDLADLHSHLGILLFQTGHSAEAERAWHRAIELQEALAAEFPEVSKVPGFRQSLAYNHNNLGALSYPAPGRFVETERAFRRALELRESLVADFPKVPEYRSDLADSYLNLGGLLQVPGRFAEAERALCTAIELQELLVAQSPNVPNYRSKVGASLNNLGDLQRDRGELAAALSSFQRAIEHQRAALRANPSSPTYREYLRNHYGGLTEVLRKQGDHAGAAQAAEEYARVSPYRAQDSVKAAGALVRCQQLAETDSRLSTADRQAKVRDYAGRAAALLKVGAEAAGDDPKALNELAWLLATCPDPRLRDPARGVELARKAIQRAPKADAMWSTLGVAQYNTGAWDEAIATLSRSVELTSGGSPADWFFLAMACWQKGDKDKARSWYDKAVQWIEKNKSQDEELRRFRDEAAALLGVTAHPKSTGKKEEDSPARSKP